MPEFPGLSTALARALEALEEAREAVRLTNPDDLGDGVSIGDVQTALAVVSSALGAGLDSLRGEVAGSYWRLRETRVERRDSVGLNSALGDLCYWLEELHKTAVAAASDYPARPDPALSLPPQHLVSRQLLKNELGAYATRLEHFEARLESLETLRGAPDHEEQDELIGYLSEQARSKAQAARIYASDRQIDVLGLANVSAGLADLAGTFQATTAGAHEGVLAIVRSQAIDLVVAGKAVAGEGNDGGLLSVAQDELSANENNTALAADDFGDDPSAPSKVKGDKFSIAIASTPPEGDITQDNIVEILRSGFGNSVEYIRWNDAIDTMRSRMPQSEANTILEKTNADIVIWAQGRGNGAFLKISTIKGMPTAWRIPSSIGPQRLEGYVRDILIALSTDDRSTQDYNGPFKLREMVRLEVKIRALSTNFSGQHFITLCARQAAILTRIGYETNNIAALKAAVECCRTALADKSLRKYTPTWARIQTLLGNAQVGQIRLQPSPDRSRRSLTPFLEAINIAGSISATQTRAWVSHCQGVALLDIDEFDPTEARILEAINLLHEALRERSRLQKPVEWAHTVAAIGRGYLQLYWITDSRTYLEQAADAFQGAFEEKLDTDPVENWSSIRSKLAISHSLLAVKRRDYTASRWIVGFAEDTLRAIEAKEAPSSWSEAVEALGVALFANGITENSIPALEQSVVALRQVLNSPGSEKAPARRAIVQFELGDALAELAARLKDVAIHRAAAAAFESAIQIATPSSSPRRWSKAQIARAEQLEAIARLEGDRDQSGAAMLIYMDVLAGPRRALSQGERTALTDRIARWRTAIQKEDRQS